MGRPVYLEMNLRKRQRSSTGQLLDALHAIANQLPLDSIALVVAIKGSTELVFADDGTAVSQLSKINTLVARQGRPVGYIAVTDSGKTRTWPLEAYKNNERVKVYLDKVESECRKTAISMPIQEIVA